jgi:hypothetical protein
MPIKSSGLIHIILILVGAVMLILFLVPLPYYQKTPVRCVAEESCPAVGWNLHVPIWKQMYRSVEKKPTSGQFTIDNNIIPTDNWKIYTNDEYQFEFKYPEYLKIEIEGEDRFSYVVSMASDGNIDMIDAFELNLVIATNEESINNLKFCIENAGKVKEGPAYNYEGEKLMLQNDLVRLGSQDGCMQKMNIDEKKVYNLLLQRGDDIFTIQFLTEGNTTIADTLVDQILSTFLFTN